MSVSRRFGLRSFRQTVALLVWGCICIPVVILCIYQIRDDYDQQLVNNQRDLILETERASFAVEQSLGQLMSDLDQIASDGSIIRSITMPILSPISVKAFQKFLGSNPWATRVMLIDQDLFPVEVLPSWALTDDLAPYQSFMSEVISSPSTILDPRPRMFVSSQGEEEEPSFIVVRPILVARNSLTNPFEVIGLVYTNVSMAQLIEHAGLTPQENESIKILYDDITLFDVSLLGETDNAIRHEKPISLGTDEQTLSIMLQKSSPKLLYKVLLAYRTQAAVVLVFIFLMFLVNKWLADRLTLPLTTLSRLTKSMSEKQFNQNGEHEEIDTSHVRYEEFNDAFELLRDMEGTITEQFKQLHDANANLENKVAERTNELERNLTLLDQKKDALKGLVQFSLDVQQVNDMEDACLMTLRLAQKICGNHIGINIFRSKTFSGYQNYESLSAENVLYLTENSDEIREYANVLKFSKNTSWLKFISVGSSTPSYQGFIVIEREEQSHEENELLQVLCTMLSSVFKQYNLTEKLQRLAHIDSLTGLSNRHYFSTRYSEKISRFSFQEEESHFGVFVIDVNGLKYVNDHHGHYYGDEMLKIVGDTLKHTARGNDIVARVGGDEFYVLLENANAEVCENFVHRLQKRSKDLSMKIDGNHHLITFSIGFASTENDAIKDLLKIADMRMYAVKQEYYKRVSS